MAKLQWINMDLSAIPTEFIRKATLLGKEYITKFVQEYLAGAVGDNAVVSCDIENVESTSGEMWEDVSYFDASKIDNYDELKSKLAGTLIGLYLTKVRVEEFAIHASCRVMGEQATFSLHITARATLFFNFLRSPEVMLRKFYIEEIIAFTPALGKVKFAIPPIHFDGENWHIPWKIYERNPVEEILRDLSANPQVGKEHLIPWAKSIHQRVVDYFKNETYAYPFTWRSGGVIEIKLVENKWITDPHSYIPPEGETTWFINVSALHRYLPITPPELSYKFQLHFAPQGAHLYTIGVSFNLLWTISLVLEEDKINARVVATAKSSHINESDSLSEYTTTFLDYIIPIKGGMLPSPSTVVPASKLQSLSRKLANEFIPYIMNQEWKFVMLRLKANKRRIHDLGTARMGYLLSLTAAQIGAKILSLPPFKQQIATPFPPHASHHWQWPSTKLMTGEDSLIRKNDQTLTVRGEAEISAPLQQEGENLILKVSIHAKVPLQNEDEVDVVVTTQAFHLRDGKLVNVLLNREWSHKIKVDTDIMEHWLSMWRNIFTQKRHIYTLPERQEGWVNFFFTHLAEQIKSAYPFP